MKETITKNEKSIKVLNEMVSRGYYKGNIEAEKFILKRCYFPNNNVIIGILDGENRFALKSEFEPIIKVAAQFLLICFAIILIISIPKFAWVYPIIFYQLVF